MYVKCLDDTGLQKIKSSKCSREAYIIISNKNPREASTKVLNDSIILIVMMSYLTLEK